MLISHSVVINRPQKEVFEFVSTFENDTKWWKAVDHTDKITPGPMGVGTVFHQTATVMGIKVINKLTVTEYVPYEYVRYINESKQLAYSLLYKYDKVGGGTKFTLEADLKMQGVLAMLAPLTMSFLKGQLEKFFNILKNYMETHPATAAA
jgi:Polyketide cyclase / dehydrase and lipid transport